MEIVERSMTNVQGCRGTTSNLGLELTTENGFNRWSIRQTQARVTQEGKRKSESAHRETSHRECGSRSPDGERTCREKRIAVRRPAPTLIRAAAVCALHTTCV